MQAKSALTLEEKKHGMYDAAVSVCTIKTLGCNV